MKKIKRLLLKYKEVIMYLIFGVATTLVNWVVYSLLMKTSAVNMTISNAIAWFTAVVFAYITNKLFVFESKSWNVAEVWKEVVKFFGARITTGVIEIGGLPLLYYIGVKQSLFGVEGFAAKILVSVIVVILNYVFSKIFVFNKRINKHVLYRKIKGKMVRWSSSPYMWFGDTWIYIDK